MGDRCSLQITVRHVPREKLDDFISCFEDHFCMVGEFDGESGRGREYYLDEINYGGYEPLGELASMGVIFEGNHGAGGEYEAANFVSDGSTVCYSSPNGPVVRIDRDGSIDENGKEEAMEYYAACEAFENCKHPPMIWPVMSAQS